MRFERDSGTGYTRVFPETFAFRPDRHDPAELYLQLDDLLRKPRLLSPRANRRDAEILISRLVLGVPRYLERVLTRLEVEGRLEAAALTKIYEDVSLLAQIFGRFVADRSGDEGPGIRMAAFHLRKLAFRSLYALMDRRVEPDYLAAYVAGSVDPVDPADDLSEAGFFYTMESGEPAAVNRCRCGSPSAPSTAGSRTSASTRRTAPSRSRTRRSTIARARCCGRSRARRASCAAAT